MIEEILKFDKTIFFKINSQWSNIFFDYILPPIRDSRFWIPLYIVLLIISLKKYKKWAILWIILIALTVGISDQTGMLIKNLFHRVRPCNSIDSLNQVRVLVKYCPQSYSFISNHAINHFTIAMYIILTFKFANKLFVFLFIFWATLICYAQVYVGVHYPLDVLFGAMLGLFIGYFSGSLFNYFYKKNFEQMILQ